MENTQKEIVFQNSSDSVATVETGSISYGGRTAAVVSTNATNHNEIFIMEKDWEEIKRKTNLINIRRHIPIVELFTGATATYGIDIIKTLLDGKTPDYSSFAISVMCLIVACIIAKLFPLFSESNNETNLVHLDDLRQLEERIDKDKDKNKK